ncbi:MAG: MATE family efflux transporter [Christensenellales bacterium]
MNNMIISLFVGLSIGVNVLVARFTGAKDAERVCETVHTAVLLSSWAAGAGGRRLCGRAPAA